KDRTDAGCAVAQNNRERITRRRRAIYVAENKSRDVAPSGSRRRLRDAGGDADARYIGKGENRHFTASLDYIPVCRYCLKNPRNRIGGDKFNRHRRIIGPYQKRFVSVAS